MSSYIIRTVSSIGELVEIWQLIQLSDSAHLQREKRNDFAIKVSRKVKCINDTYSPQCEKYRNVSSQCFGIFLPLRFYVKSILEIAGVANLSKTSKWQLLELPIS